METTQPEQPRPNDKAERQQLFLEVFAKVGNVSQAAAEIRMHRSTHYEWMTEEDSDYPKRFQSAEEEFRDLVRETVRQRAILGWTETVTDRYGKAIGERERFSERLLELLAKAKCPEFRDKHEITTTVKGSVSLEVKQLAEVFTTEELLKIRERIRTRAADHSGTGRAGAPPSTSE